VLGFAIWGELPSWMTLAGASLACAAGIYNLHRARVRRAADVNRPRSQQGQD